MNDRSSKTKVSLRERCVIHEPSLTKTLQSLEPGDFVRLGSRWSYGTVRQTASQLKISIKCKRDGAKISVVRYQDLP